MIEINWLFVLGVIGFISAYSVIAATISAILTNCVSETSFVRDEYECFVLGVIWPITILMFISVSVAIALWGVVLLIGFISWWSVLLPARFVYKNFPKK